MQSFATLLIFLCFSPRARGVHVDDGFFDVLHLGGGEIAKRVVLRAEVFHESYKFVVLHFQLLLSIGHYPHCILDFISLVFLHSIGLIMDSMNFCSDLVRPYFA